MKERPILFSAPMVRAILNGSKTQTRRIAPIEELNLTRSEYEPLFCPGEKREFHSWFVKFQRKENGRTKGPKGVSCSTSGTGCTELQARQYIAQMYNPYGVPGDRLWVRETWYPNEPKPWYRADFIQRYEAWECDTAAGILRLEDAWKPSIFMPRWASRITLEIVSVRVERLQSISEEDAIAEGVEVIGEITDGLYWTKKYRDYRMEGHFRDPKESYCSLWESINGPGSWDANPWVWVVEFKKIEVAP